ncbi:MAG: hypothetical protein R2706_18830 [Acidimicrobiales bacterium]
MIILLVAVLAGAMASFAIYTYVGNVKTEAAQGSQMVDVWRNRRDSQGNPSRRSDPAWVHRAEKVEISSRPLTAIDDPSVEILGLVAVIDIPANVPLVEGLFVEPGVVATGITDRLEERGLVTVTINVDQVNGVANFIEPGDRVQHHLRSASGKRLVQPQLRRVRRADGAAVPVDSASSGTEVVGTAPFNNGYVYQYVEVLAVGKNLTDDLGTVTTNPDGTPVQQADSGLITMARPTRGRAGSAQCRPELALSVLGSSELRAVSNHAARREPALPW